MSFNGPRQKRPLEDKRSDVEHPLKKANQQNFDEVILKNATAETSDMEIEEDSIGLNDWPLELDIENPYDILYADENCDYLKYNIPPYLPSSPLQIHLNSQEIQPGQTHLDFDQLEKLLKYNRRGPVG